MKNTTVLFVFWQNQFCIIFEGFPCIDWGKDISGCAFDSIKIPTDEWIHLAFVIDTSENIARVYINGVEKASKTGSFLYIAPNRVSIGSLGTTSDIDIGIALARFWARPLLVEEFVVPADFSSVPKSYPYKSKTMFFLAIGLLFGKNMAGV